MPVTHIFNADSDDFEKHFPIGFCTVKHDTRSNFGKTTFHCSADLYDFYAPLIERHRCDVISIVFSNALNGDKWKTITNDIFDLSRIGELERVQELSLSGTGAFAKTYDFSLFDRFTSLRSLWLDEVKLPVGLLEKFQGLIALKIDYAANKWQKEVLALPNLRKIRAEKFKGSIGDLGNEELDTMFLFWPGIGSLDGIEKYQNLETLFIFGCRSEIDLSRLNACKRLTGLKLERTKSVKGWDRFDGSRLRSLDLDSLPSIGILDGYRSDLSFFAKQVGDIREKPVARRDHLAEVGDPFASITDRWFPRS